MLATLDPIMQHSSNGSYVGELGMSYAMLVTVSTVMHPLCSPPQVYNILQWPY